MKKYLKNLDQQLFGGKLLKKYQSCRNQYYNRRAHAIASKFHHYFYKLQAYEDQWMGVRCVQNPFDMWIKHKIIWETRPDIIIETGTLCGGTALFYATLLETIGHGKVVTIDVDPHIEEASKHPLFIKRVQVLKGMSTSPEIAQEVAKQVSYNNAMLILDSDHSKENVLKELKLYSHFVAPGNYIIVDDSQLNGHPVLKSFGPGPYEAIHEFLSENNEFEIDPSREKFFMTFNPSGYLRRKEISSQTE